ncbi:TPA: hypothetical protein QHT46_004277, partial [Enterobacter asburiae]|nr:hypothetical protein [Enterobacter asburiae]
MQNLMPPVNTPDNLFHDGNPVTGELGTIVEAEHLNNEQSAIRDVQRELINVLTAAGIDVDPNNHQQLLTALTVILVSATGGDYNGTFRFKKVSTLPSIDNPSSLFSAEGNPAQNTLVAGVEAAWHAHKVRAGVLRDSGINVLGYAVEIDGNRQFQTDLNGNLIATAALYESGGTGNPVRAYSPNNPPPQQDLSGYLKKTDVGTKAGSVAAGNDSRIIGALQLNNRLSEIAQAGAAAQQQAIDNLGGIHGRLVGSRAYTSSGTYVPGAGIKYARVTVTGGGGSGTGTPGGGYRGAGGGA